MARFSFNGNPPLSDELFKEAMASDRGIHECATASSYCDKNGRLLGKYVNYPSWEDVHDITDEQIAEAKKNYQRRRFELLEGLTDGVLAFVAMGGNFTSQLEDGVGNHRMRGDFCNSRGEQFFVEFSLMAKEESFIIVFSIDRQLQKKYEKEQQEWWERNKDLRLGKREPINDSQYYYNAKEVEKNMSVKVRATWPDVLKFINETYGCNYKTAMLFRYFISPEDFICHCKAEKPERRHIDIMDLF